MANFARSLKSPYLSPRLRPSMPARTMSSSSDLSHQSSNSPLSEDLAELSISGRNTPTILNGQNIATDGIRDTNGTGFRGAQTRDDYENLCLSSSRPSTPRSNNSHSRPIAIELPQIRRFGVASVRTPPEPVSARGDLPGGYFPLHEDPSSRVHRPHPFQTQKEDRLTRHQPSNLVVNSRPVNSDHPTSNPIQTLPMAQSNTPVASYLPAGFHDNPLPMGKYYPSNYEQRASDQTSLRPSFPGSLSSTFRSESHMTPRAADLSQIPTPESEVQRKLQQYQRDMIAQASLAAGELLGGSTSGSKVGGSVSFSSVHVREPRFKTLAPLKPMSPQLLPLGSPGPVTPMSLESTEAGHLTLGGIDARQGDTANYPSGI